MTTIQVSVQGSNPLQETIKRLTKALDQTEILDESAALVLNRTLRRFLAEERPDGVKWVRSKAAIKRAAQGYGGDTLFKTGRLFHSIQLASSTQSERFIGTDVPYGWYHQRGKDDMFRPFLGFGEGDVTDVQKLLIKRIREAFK